MARCEAGDMQAIKHLADRLDGRPAQMWLVATAAENRLSFRTTRRSRPPRLPNNPAAGRRGLRSSHADSGAQTLPPARATVPSWLRESSSRVSSLLACYALGPPACAARCSCHREACSARSAWLLLGRACLSAWIEHRSGEQRSPQPMPQGESARAQLVHARAQVVRQCSGATEPSASYCVGRLVTVAPSKAAS